MIRKAFPRFLAIAWLVVAAMGSSDAREASDLKAYQGKVVYVDFWASWCGPCRRSFPWMNQMQKKYQDRGFVVVGINLDSEKSLADQFLAETPARFDILFDPDAGLAKEFGIVGMPSSFIMNKNGEVIAKHVGFKRHQSDDYERAIRQALELE